MPIEFTPTFDVSFPGTTKNPALKQNNWIYWSFPLWNCFLSDPNKLVSRISLESLGKFND